MALSYGEIAAKALIHASERQDFSFNGYEKAVMSHLLGGHTRNCIRLASKLYSGQGNPLHLVQQFFSGQFNRPDLLSLLLRPKRT